jgi:hypothetical protein
MEGGRFIIAVLLILIVGGGSAYYSYTQITQLQGEVASIQAKLVPINQNAVTAANIAKDVKVEADAAKADAAKAAAGIDALNTAVTALQTKPAAAPAPAKKK